MKEEDKLLKKVGTGNPFTVPGGYFENLTSQVMNELPEQKKPDFKVKEPTTWDKVKPWMYMAAMFVGAALIINVASRTPDPFAASETPATETLAADAPLTEEYLDYALTQTLMDDYSLYVYLTDAE